MQCPLFICCQPVLVLPSKISGCFVEVFCLVEKAGLMALPVLAVFNMSSLWIFCRAFWGATSVSRSGIRNGPFHSSNAVLHYI